MRKPYDEFDKRLFNERIEKLLHENKSTIEQLCSCIWCSPLQYERHIKTSTKRIDDETVDAIAAFFKIHPDYLMGLSDCPQEYFITPGKIGENMAQILHELRIEKGFTHEDVARNIGVPLNTYKAIERYGDEPSLEIAVKLADYFNISLDYLVGRSDNPERR